MPADDVGMVGWLWGFAWTHVANDDATLSKQIFDITVAEIEPVVKPDSVTSDIRREPVAFVCIHRRIIPFLLFNLSYMNHPLLQVDYQWFL